MDSDTLPCYVVCDVSLSMIDHIDELNAGLREFCGAVHADSSMADRVRCCIVEFAETPHVAQPLRSITRPATLAALDSSAGTNFGPAFALVRETVEQDVRARGVHGPRTYRPVVFFLSDGQPTDSVTWPVAFATLTDPAWPDRPNMIAFGVGDSDRSVLGRIGTFRTFFARDGVRMGTALIASVHLALPRADYA